MWCILIIRLVSIMQRLQVCGQNARKSPLSIIQPIGGGKNGDGSFGTGGCMDVMIKSSVSVKKPEKIC